jgi:hypothetical protein
MIGDLRLIYVNPLLVANIIELIDFPWCIRISKDGCGGRIHFFLSISSMNSWAKVRNLLSNPLHSMTAAQWRIEIHLRIAASKFKSNLQTKQPEGDSDLLRKIPSTKDVCQR